MTTHQWKPNDSDLEGIWITLSDALNGEEIDADTLELFKRVDRELEGDLLATIIDVFDMAGRSLGFDMEAVFKAYQDPPDPDPTPDDYRDVVSGLRAMLKVSQAE